MPVLTKIVETDNLGGDYPNEKFVNLPKLSEKVNQQICDLVNFEENYNGIASRYWKVVPRDYVLQPGFEP